MTEVTYHSTAHIIYDNAKLNIKIFEEAVEEIFAFFWGREDIDFKLIKFYFFISIFLLDKCKKLINLNIIKLVSCKSNSRILS